MESFVLYSVNCTWAPIDNFIHLLRSMQGVTKRCRLSWLTSSAFEHEPKCGGMGVSANEYSCAHGAQVNFRDLIPYITYVSDNRNTSWFSFHPSFIQCTFCTHINKVAHLIGGETDGIGTRKTCRLKIQYTFEKKGRLWSLGIFGRLPHPVLIKNVCITTQPFDILYFICKKIRNFPQCFFA
jgi:hypothetical protein